MQVSNVANQPCFFCDKNRFCLTVTAGTAFVSFCGDCLYVKSISLISTEDAINYPPTTNEEDEE